MSGLVRTGVDESEHRWSRRPVPVLMLMLALFAGCQPDAKMEERIKSVELRQEKLRGEVAELSELTKELSKTTRDTYGSLMAGNAEMRTNLANALNIIWDIQADMEAVRATNAILLAARAQRPVAVMPAQRYQPMQLRDGVPIGTYNEIAADATRKWPGNFEMQAYEIKLQTEAYRKLHP